MAVATQPQEKLHDLLEDFGTAMLVTHTTDGRMRARPMALAQVDEGSDLWFVTGDHSGKAHEIAADAHVCVSLQSGNKFVSVTGRANLVHDRARIHELWNEAWKVWFPKGKDDPEIVLIRVTSEEGEFWDNSGTNSLKYLFEAGKAYLSGTTPAIDETQHGKTRL